MVTTNYTQSALERRIMRRVYLIWGLRLALHPDVLKSLIVAVFIWRSTKYFSYTHVLANMPSLLDVGAEYHFMKDAMFHAHPMTLVFLSSAAWLAVWVLADMIFKRQQSAWI